MTARRDAAPTPPGGHDSARTRRETLGIGLLLGLWVACAPTPGPERPAEVVTLRVFAATSLREAFTRLGARFEAAHPGVKVVFNFAGTQTLRTQLEQGAAADVFAAADTVHMDALARAGRVDAPVLFAANVPVLVVTPEASSVVRGVADLPAVGRLVLGAPEVPIGRYASEILARAESLHGAGFRARVEARVVSRELNVGQVLSKVALGEADAAFVYRTDVARPDGRYVVLALPAALAVEAKYPVAVVRGAAARAWAEAWVAALRGPEGRAILGEVGFEAR